MPFFIVPPRRRKQGIRLYLLLMDLQCTRKALLRRPLTVKPQNTQRLRRANLKSA